MDEFDFGPDGNVRFMPLAGWRTSPMGGMALVAKLAYFPTPEALQLQKPETVQLTLTPAQCRELGELLLRMAHHLSQPPENVSLQ